MSAFTSAWVSTSLAGGFTPEATSAWAAAVSALAAVVTAAIAIWALASSASDSRARTRPTLLAQFEKGPDGSSVILFVVRNVGPTSAEDVSVSFEPDLPLPGDDVRPTLLSYAARRYADAIPSLGPGQALSNIWRTSSDDESDAGTPPWDVTVTVQYKGRKARPIFNDVFAISAKPLSLETYVGSSDDSVKGRIKGLAGEVAKLRQSVDKLRH